MDDELLRSFREQGQWDSEGAFTLDPEQVWRKLGQFALADERRYLLHLVSWAIGRGATAVEITHEVGRLEVRPRGPLALPTGYLESLLGAPGSAAPGARDLLIATSTAALRKGARVTFEAQEQRLLADADGLRLASGGAANPIWLLEESVSRFSNLVGRLLGDQVPEVALLREGFVHSEVPICVNGEPIGLPLRLPVVRKGIHLAGPPQLPITPEELAHSEILSRPSTGSFSCLVLSSRHAILPTRALYIVQGLTFERPPVQWDGENFVVVVNAPGLEKDLSGQGLVENPALREIDDQVTRLVQELQESPS